MIFESWMCSVAEDGLQEVERGRGVSCQDLCISWCLWVCRSTCLDGIALNWSPGQQVSTFVAQLTYGVSETSCSLVHGAMVQLFGME